MNGTIPVNLVSVHAFALVIIIVESRTHHCEQGAVVEPLGKLDAARSLSIESAHKPLVKPHLRFTDASTHLMLNVRTFI